jgi:fibronectin-binding autotransporter adhesin
MSLSVGTTVNLNGTDAVRSITQTGGGTLSLSQGSFTASAGGGIAGALAITGGSVTVGATAVLTVNDLTQSGGSIAGGQFILTGTSTFSGGQVSGGTVLNQGTLVLNGYAIGDGATVENASTATLFGRNQFNLTGVLRNDAGATMTAAAGASLFSSNGASSAFTALFDNRGSLVVDSGGLTVGTIFNDSGTVTLNPGGALAARSPGASTAPPPP